MQASAAALLVVPWAVPEEATSENEFSNSASATGTYNSNFAAALRPMAAAAKPTFRPMQASAAAQFVVPWALADCEVPPVLFRGNGNSTAAAETLEREDEERPRSPLAPLRHQPCPHGKQRSYFCRECGGGAFCTHGRNRYTCKECGGKGICAHGRHRFSCKEECGGRAFCAHGRKRTTCKECSGGAFCEHGQQRTRCKECGGGALCEHGRRRYTCKECGGKGICGHGRHRYRCKECGGGGICEHVHVRRECRTCNPALMMTCTHGRRHQCKACGGKPIKNAAAGQRSVDATVAAVAEVGDGPGLAAGDAMITTADAL
ncbi:hypothetical protein JKP88DRAFT_253092 [Tribonema minus]|uniref:Uncharacterized protein n=1 Tax=Tribonema minus TaxID=303371 RepID=A0A836CKQ3_9STRA|nr:hypothetical protein JKP88DRAFT_253092 [Tribonema minus]